MLKEVIIAKALLVNGKDFVSLVSKEKLGMPSYHPFLCLLPISDASTDGNGNTVCNIKKLTMSSA